MCQSSTMPSFNSSDDMPSIEEILESGGRAKKTIYRESWVAKTFENFVREGIEKVSLLIFFYYSTNQK